MKTLLRIDASARQKDSDSRALSQQFVDDWQTRNPNGHVIKRDLAQESVPHLDETTLAAFMQPTNQQNEAAKSRNALSEKLIEEFMAADEIIISTPMYNFGIPSTLKAYFDHIARAGITFRYTENGPEGLAGGRPVTLLLTRGGMYTGSPLDHQGPYLNTFLTFLGITDIETVIAEGWIQRKQGEYRFRCAGWQAQLDRRRKGADN
jgi:FMN-dependent NADH-azoreductase